MPTLKTRSLESGVCFMRAETGTIRPSSDQWSSMSLTALTPVETCCSSESSPSASTESRLSDSSIRLTQVAI